MTRQRHIATRRRIAWVAAALGAVAALVLAGRGAQATEALTTLEYRVVGVALRPERSQLAIPKNIPGALRVELIAGGDGNESLDSLADGAIVEATLRGPSFSARRVVGLPNGDLDLPPLPLVGDYSLDDLRLVDAATGATRLDGSPRSVPIQVFDDVLVSRVTSRPLAIDEIEDRGIAIDSSNFRVLEFEVGFVVDGATVPVRFPVVAPRFDGAVELIPQAELEALLAEAEVVNAALSLGAELPPELEATGLDIEVKGVNFQFVDEDEGPDLGLAVPPIPGLVVIPGRIGLLNQFFSVLLFTENAAPGGSGLSVHDLVATLELPPGADRVPGTHEAPGDDPLRFAKVGAAAEIQPTQRVRGVGADGALGTDDDVDRLEPGRTGQAEFLVEGLREGLHVMDITIDGVLDGLGTRERRIRGFASGSVLVRNPKFSLAFTHPRTIRAGEPYTASVTVLNTSTSPANLVSVSLPQASLSGAVFEPGTSEVAELGTIRPGETAIAEFRLRAQRTGAITFSQLTSDGDIVGRFRLRMGVDERGVPLSPDAIGYPDYAEDLRSAVPGVFATIERYLGQALSVASAAQLPPGVQPVSRTAVERRVVEVAEAGQRLRYGDTLARVLADLLLDFQGARRSNAGLDEILRETDAGRELREAMLAAVAGAETTPNAVELLAAHAADWAGRGEPWLAIAVDEEAWQPSIELLGARVELGDSLIGDAVGYGGAPSDAVSGHWLIARPLAATLRFVAPVGGAPAAQIALLDLAGDGSGRLLEWSAPALAAGGCLRAELGGPAPALVVDETCDGSAESQLVATQTDVSERDPELLAVVQDEQVLVARPAKPCPRGDIANYGNVVAALFSKPMTQASVDLPAAYRLDDGNGARSVQIQPGGRVALLSLTAGVGTIHPRTLTVDPGVTDPRGNPLLDGAVEVQTTAALGVAIRGRVVRGTGEPAVDVPVTLTIYDESEGFTCEPYVVRASQLRSDADGRFHFDYVPAGIPYSVSATDTTGLGREAEQLILDASSDAQVDRERLLELATGSASQTLLDQFIVGALPEAIAAAEGLDRALLRDSVDVGSPRVGTEVPVALRFRGRGTVTGTVFGSNGTTPVANAAVNLFPDPDSRELGRGVLSDTNGRFAFQGVPLGSFTIEAINSAGRTRTVSGALLEPGAVEDVPIVLSGSVVERSALTGRVVEADGTPHPGASVYVGRYDEVHGFTDVVAIATADENGSWRAEGIPVGLRDLVAVSFDGHRRGERRNVAVSAGVANFSTIALQDRTVVRGRVLFANGTPAANALVAGGTAIVRSDENGFFTLEGVPTGQRSIEAAVEVDPSRGVEFTRLGSASLRVLAGIENFVTVRLNPAGRIVGRVLDAAGAPVPNLNVSIPRQGGFLWVKADAEGRFVFENIALDDYTVSAPAPPVADNDVSGILDTLSGSPSSDEMLAAITRAFEIFTGVNDPLLNGEGANFNPLDWGYTDTELSFDGQTQIIEVQFLPRGTISGTVRNGQGVPIGARVRLTGIGATKNGDKGFVIRGERNSDPALGTFEFPGEALAGDWGLQAASPFFPAAISISGQTNRIEPDATGLLLQFPDGATINGRLTGTVLGQDGQPVGAGVAVRISFGDDYEIHTTEDGRFDTQFDLPAVNDRGEAIGYAVEAEDPVTGLRGQSFVALQPGVTTDTSVRLLGKGSLRVRVVDGTGQPAVGADVSVDQMTFPQDRFTGQTDASGELELGNLFAGSYAIGARLASGVSAVSGRSSASVAADAEALATVRLGATGTIRGRFVGVDGVTPIAAAQIRVGVLGFATTDDAGAFEVVGVPLGTHVISAQDAVTGRLGVVPVTLGVAGEIRNVLVVERSLGVIEGNVLSGFGNATVPGATVTLRFADGLVAPRVVTADPAGAFHFPSAPAGAFSIEAVDPVSQLSGQVSSVLLEGVGTLQVDVPLTALTNLTVQVRDPAGAPASAASVELSIGNEKRSIDTAADGRVRFTALALGSYTLRAVSLVPGQSRSSVVESVSLTRQGESSDVTLTLSGVGRVEGRVLASDGTTPLPARSVSLEMMGDLPVTIETATGADGSYAFEDVAVAPFRLIARDVALASSESGEIHAAGEVANVDLVLGPSGSIVGRLVSQDGALGIAGAQVVLAYMAPSGALGRAFFTTGVDGSFAFDAIPVGAFALEAIVFARDGIARLDGVLVSNGQVLDLGDVPLDEQDPYVVVSEPAAGDADVPIDQVVRLTFNEALADAPIDPQAIYLRGPAGRVPAQLSLELDTTSGEPRVLTIRPDAPLASETEFQAVVVDGELLSAVGAVIAEGPVDRVGRSLATAFTSSFRTRDQDPPGLLSLTPDDGAIQADPRAVVRLSFDEPIAAEGIAFTLTGPDGAVPGRVDIGVDSRVLVFTPTAPLRANASYTAQVDGIRDIAGNLAEGLPFSTSFQTLDTLGPGIATLALSGPAVGGATRNAVATLAQPETGVSIRVSADLVTIGQSAPGVLSVPVTLPLSGSLILRAVAIDRFGNEGPIAELPVSVLANQPPSVSFTRILPPSGAVLSGSTLSVRVSGSDDVSVASLKAAASGAASAPLATSAGTPITVSVAVPADTGPGQRIVVLGEAIDGNNQSSGEQSLAIAVADGVAPTISIVAPAADSEVAPGAALAIDVTGTDAFGITRFEIETEGAFTATQSQALAGTPGAASASFSLDVPAVLATGESFTLRARAFDAAGHSAETSIALSTPDQRAPRLVELLPPDGAAVALAPEIAARFDEPIARDSVLEQLFRLRDAANAVVPTAIGFADEDRVVTLTPLAPLASGETYRVVLSGGLRDLAGNFAADADGNLLASVEHAFTVGGAELVAPISGARVIEGQSIAASVVVDLGLGASAVRFRVNGATVATIASNPPAPPATTETFGTTLTAPTVAEVGGSALRIGAAAVLASDPEGPGVLTNEATLELLAAADDFDGDGISNGDEIGYGTNPFADDRLLDDDGDGLTNAEEFALGTNKDDVDTDHDGLADAAELAAGLDPLDPDTDGDGLPDGEDVLGGPRVTAFEPNAGAVNVSVRPRIRVRFDEPFDPTTVTAASFALLENGTAPVAASFLFSEGNRVVDLLPNAPLAFSTSYTVQLTNGVAGADAEPIRNTDGSDVTAPIERSFTTGVFGLLEPAGGAAVSEGTTLALAASGDASLGIASVRFEVNGTLVSTATAAPFEASFAVPPANITPTLDITAIAFDAGDVEIARDTISVSVVVGLDVASRVFGVPLGGTRDLVLRLPVARASALEVTLTSIDPAVASVPAQVHTIPAGETELRVPVSGIAEGGTSLIAETLEDRVVIAASVSALAPGTTLETVASPTGVAVQPFASVGLVAVAPDSTSVVTLRLFATPVAQDTLLAISSSDPAAASVLTPVVVPAGSNDATIPISAGPSGEAVLQLVGGGTGRELRVVVGMPDAANTPPVFAAPIGVVIVPFPSAGDVIVPVSSTRTVTLRILGEPLAVDIELVITSSDPAIASIAGPVVIPAGSTDATFEITTGAAGTAIVTLVAGDDGRELRVISGAPSAADTPPVFAPPIGIVIVPFPSAGDVIVPESSTRTVTLRVLTTPAAVDTELVIGSSDASIASIAGPVVIPAGSTDAVFEITTGAAGTAVVTLIAGDEGRELRVISGAPSAADTPPVFAPPIGVVIVPFPSAGDVIVPVSSTRSVTLRVLSAAAPVDTELVVESSDPSIASIAGPVVIPAGSIDATFEITTGAAGTAIVTLIAGDDGRELRVISGAPSAADTPPVFAPPIGLTVMEAGSAGTLFLDPGATRTFDLTLLAFPSLGDLPVSAVSLDPAVATVSPDVQLIPTGESAVTLTVTATALADAETRIDLVFGVERRTLRVVVGVPATAEAPTTIAPPVGIEVQEAP